MDFSQLNYTLANEDSSCERTMVAPHANIACMVGSGARVISLLASSPKAIYAFDSSHRQILMAKFRLELLEQLEWNEYCGILGYPSDLSSKECAELRQELIFSKEVASFLTEQADLHPGIPPIYWGIWEQSMIKNAQALKTILGADFIEELTLGKQFDQILKSPLKKMRYKFALQMVGHARFLAKNFSSKQLPQLSQNRDEQEYYNGIIRSALKAREFKKNFFLQLLFTGKINSVDALPDEADPEVFRLAKRSLSTTSIQFRQSDLRTAAPTESFDFVFFSDVFSYLTNEESTDVLARFTQQLSRDGIIMMRFYRNRPHFVLDDDLGYANQFQDLIPFEMTGAYEFCVLKRTAYKHIAYPIKEGARCVLGSK